MIISASRRTDIPSFYSQWLWNRIRSGTVKTRNPFNPAQVREISLKPRDVDCFVFWTKDPAPMLNGLGLLDELGIPYYFQFTLTPYSHDLETNLRDKREIIETFRTLSRRIGAGRVRWRYDPIILNDGLDIPWHLHAFQKLCGLLEGYSQSVTISFVDQYAKVKTPLIRPITNSQIHRLASGISPLAADHGFSVNTCCETADLSHYTITKAHCIDPTLIQQLSGRSLSLKPDRYQRPGCGCAQSIDIGAYNTCANGCIYCYASHSPKSVARSRLRHNPHGAFLLED